MTARQWALISAIVAVHLGVDFWMPRMLERQHDYLVALAIGLVIGQLNLVATWSALATGKVLVRVPWAAFLATLGWYALVLGNRFVERWQFNRSDAVFLGFLLLCGVLLTQIPLWVARARFAWRLIPPGGTTAAAARHDRQFSLGQLLSGIAVVSIALGLGRLVLPPGDSLLAQINQEIAIILPVLAIVNLALTSPCIWMAFARGNPLWGWAGGWIFYALAVSAIEVQVLTLLLGPPGSSDILIIAWIINLTQCGTVFGTLLLLRVTGFQLARIHG